MFFTGKLICKFQTEERYPFRCTGMIFTRADGQCFMPPVIVHQAENCTQDLHWNLPSDWLFHNMPLVYMNRGGQMKAMSLFSRTCGASKINPQVLLFDVHDSHFDDRSTHLLWSQNTPPFILKSGDSTNDYPNDNGPNLNLKKYYGIAKLKWQRQHGTMKFTPTHTSSVIVDIWHSFQQKPASVIIEAFKKTKLLSLSPPDHDNNPEHV